MKLQNKIALGTIVIGLCVIIIISLVYNMWNKNNLVEQSLENNLEVANGVSQEIDNYMNEIINTVKTLSTTPLISERLKSDNLIFQSMNDRERQRHIETLSIRWKENDDLESDFIKTYMDNDVSRYLNEQKELLSGRYGEIFITNKYGVAIATTNKLTTVEHAHKYWWQGSYNEGQGQIFLDDRGFDPSAQGYVLGIVMPIKENDEIIGIIKANVNIQELLKTVVENYETIHENTSVKIARTSGYIVYAKGIEPLTESVGQSLTEALEAKDNRSLVYEEEGENYVGALSVIQVTNSQENVVFGGSYESIDHIMGNQGENWHVVLTQKEEDILLPLRKTLKDLTLIGLLLTIFISILGMVMGKRMSSPLVRLADMSNEIGAGDYKQRIDIQSNDEIGVLADSYNQMVDRLQQTMEAKDEEVERRKQAEAESLYQSHHDYLTDLYNRRYVEQLICELKDEENYPMTFVMGDVNGLKRVNDSISHFAGDKLLVHIADLLKSKISDKDILARWGGDEFVIIFLHKDYKDVEKIMDSIALKTSATYDYLEVGISFGLNTRYSYNESWEECLGEAEIEMYQNKIAAEAGTRRETVDTILTAYHAKSPKEALHSKRVAELCHEIGKKMGYTRVDQNKLRLAGLLHDIGKIGIRDEVLTKNGRLNDNEREQMRNHPEIGYRILYTAPEMRDVAKWIRAHHERMDGKGYPNGLSGDDIPIFSRIITVADSYDAMVSWRPYKEALSDEFAISELYRNSGSQFDPQVVEVFVHEVLGKSYGMEMG